MKTKDFKLDFFQCEVKCSRKHNNKNANESNSSLIKSIQKTFPICVINSFCRMIFRDLLVNTEPISEF